MPNHHVKVFIDKDINNNLGDVCYVHHNTDKPSDDDAGLHAKGQTGDRLKWRSRDDGGFTIQFDDESPFESGAGANGSPAISATASSNGEFETTLEKLKKIASPKQPFKYTITFLNSGKSDDPEIIIDNSSGGGGHKKKAKKKRRR